MHDVCMIPYSAGWSLGMCKARATSSRVEEERPKRSQMAQAFSREPCRLCSWYLMTSRRWNNLQDLARRYSGLNYYWNHGTGAVHSSLRQRIRAVGNQSKEPNVSYRASLHPLLSGRWRPQWNLHNFNWNGMRNAHLKITTGNSPRLF